MKQPTDYVKREERVPADNTDIILLAIWTATGSILGWIGCMLYFGINLL